jgi:hypothetical protein
MPRAALGKFSLEVLQAELARRAKKAGKKLSKLIRQRAKLTEQIAELEALAGETRVAAPKAKLGRPPGKKRGPKPKAVAPAAKPKPAAPVTVRHKRGTFPQTGAEFIVGLLQKDGATSTEINRKWTAASRNGTADVLLSQLTKAGTLKRIPLPKGQRGSTYTLKGAAPAEAPRKRGTYALTAAEFVLGLVKGKGATTAEITAAWKKAGRGGVADNTLTRMLKAGTVKRTKLAVGKGSTYTLA